MDFAKVHKIAPGEFKPGVVFFYLGKGVFFDVFHSAGKVPADLRLTPSQHADDLALGQFMQIDEPQQHSCFSATARESRLQRVAEKSYQCLLRRMPARGFERSWRLVVPVLRAVLLNRGVAGLLSLAIDPPVRRDRGQPALQGALAAELFEE